MSAQEESQRSLVTLQAVELDLVNGSSEFSAFCDQEI